MKQLLKHLLKYEFDFEIKLAKITTISKIMWLFPIFIFLINARYKLLLFLLAIKLSPKLKVANLTLIIYDIFTLAYRQILYMLICRPINNIKGKSATTT